MAGLYAPLPTLRRRPRGRPRTARGRCGSLLLHRSGLSPPTPCRSPGALTRVAAPTPPLPLAAPPARSLGLRPAPSRRPLYVPSYPEGFSLSVPPRTAPFASGGGVQGGQRG